MTHDQRSPEPIRCRREVGEVSSLGLRQPDVPRNREFAIQEDLVVRLQGRTGGAPRDARWVPDRRE